MFEDGFWCDVICWVKFWFDDDFLMNVDELGVVKMMCCGRFYIIVSYLIGLFVVLVFIFYLNLSWDEVKFLIVNWIDEYIEVMFY